MKEEKEGMKWRNEWGRKEQMMKQGVRKIEWRKDQRKETNRKEDGGGGGIQNKKKWRKQRKRMRKGR